MHVLCLAELNRVSLLLNVSMQVLVCVVCMIYVCLSRQLSSINHCVCIIFLVCGLPQTLSHCLFMNKSKNVALCLV